MAVNLTNADSALKSYYLDVVKDKLNYSVNPFLAAIKHSTEDVYGKDVRKLAVHGLNGGIGAGTEDGKLPASSSNNYTQLVSTLKNIYGTIEISDKAIRASQSDTGAFVSLLNAEMEGLINASTYNFGRMLFGDGTGKIAKVACVNPEGVLVDSVEKLKVGMVVDFCTLEGEIIPGGASRKIADIDVINSTFNVVGEPLANEDITADCILTVQGSCNNEITGLGAIFGNASTLYGIDRVGNDWLKPYKAQVSDITENDIQTALDEIEIASGNSVNFIVCSWGVRRALIKLLSENRSNIHTMELTGGFKAISYNGIPIVADRFCPKGTMYLLNTDDFSLNQLCDWQWMEGDDGKVLRQVPGKPVYTATLVKYVELMCSRPCGQGMISGIKEA
ncbi:MAG: phage major capsid protein [Clostridia bacterium]|nr:phage major capsid protein [Clostridia bacterium]